MTGKLSYDSEPQLAVIVVYAACYVAHTVFMFFSCQHYFIQVSAGAAWSLPNRDRFAVVNRRLLFDHIRDETHAKPLDFIEIDKTSVGSNSVPSTYAAVLEGRTRPPCISRFAEEVRDLDEALKAVEKDKEKARSCFNSAAESALDRVIANAVAMLGICITSGFATYTAKPLSDNSSSQIGSLALLASALVGLSAMFSSALHLSIMNKSFQQILMITELKTNGKAVEYFKNVLNRNGAVGFTQNSLKARTVKVSDLFRAMNWWHWILAIFFGPAYGLLPNEDDNARRSRDASFEHHISVRDRDVVLTTGWTDKHRRGRSGGENVEAINVYCQGSEAFSNEAVIEGESSKLAGLPPMKLVTSDTTQSAADVATGSRDSEEMVQARMEVAWGGGVLFGIDPQQAGASVVDGEEDGRKGLSRGGD
jgi:hypothetical protein